jgi:ATP-binding cassette subfamily B protein
MTTFGTIVRRGGGWLPMVGLAALADSLTALALPMVLGYAVDAIVTGGDTGRWLAIAAVLIAIGVAADVVDAFASTACVARITAWLRARLVRHVLAIGPHRARRFDTGDLVSRVSGNAVDAAQAGPSSVLIVTEVLPPVGSLVLLAVIDPWLAGAFLAGVALVVLVLRTFALRTAEVLLAYQQTQGRIAARLAESLAGARTIAAAGTVERETRRVLEPLRDLHGHGVRTWWVLSRTAAQAAVVGPLVLVAVLVAGGFALVNGRISAGELFAAIQYAAMGAGLGGLTGLFGELARARAGIRRVADVLGEEPVRYGGTVPPDGPGHLEFRGVTVRAARSASGAHADTARSANGMRVDTGEATVLDGVDLAVPGGAAVAIVGPSGAGKSILAALAARLRDPDEGQVLLDGVPLTELSRDALRAAVGCAFERPVLVGRTVADAIGPQLGRSQVRAAARATHAHEFVSRLPRGYDTPLTDAPMSGGEAQRLGLARAWRAERLLVLDDATSSLDMVTEMQISHTLTDDHGGRTRLIVTHRPTTAAHADLVVWLEAGRVRRVGPHEVLWDDPDYRRVFG